MIKPERYCDQTRRTGIGDAHAFVTTEPGDESGIEAAGIEEEPGIAMPWSSCPGCSSGIAAAKEVDSATPGGKRQPEAGHAENDRAGPLPQRIIMPIPAKRFVVFCLLLAAALAARADQPLPAPKPPAKVMLLGLFHFDNPGLDAVKYQPQDVMQPAAQAYLVTLAERLSRFAPTRILLEYPDRIDATINRRFADYLSGKYDLPKNEIYQLGFRIAKHAGHARVYGFDADMPAFDAVVWSYLPKEPATEQKLMALIASESLRQEHAHRSMSLREILAMSNSAQEDRRNKGFYMLLNGVAAQTRLFHGADAIANWWHRNIRMYALVQMHAQPGERVLVIAGSGHTAILRDFLRADGDRAEEDVLPYFQGP